MAASARRLIRDTLINTLPMAILLGISLRYADRPFPRWLKWITAILYGVFFAGELQAWWIPCFFGTPPDRIARYRAMFGKTHAFLPERNGIVPNTMHVVLHSATLAALLVALRLVMLTAADARQPAHGARVEQLASAGANIHARRVAPIHRQVFAQHRDPGVCRQAHAQPFPAHAAAAAAPDGHLLLWHDSLVVGHMWHDIDSVGVVWVQS